MKRSFVYGVVAAVIAVAVAVPTLAHRKEEARRNWRDLPQSQRELRVPTAEALDTIFPNGAHQVLEQSPQLTLFSVDPSPEDYDSQFNSKTHPMFHGHMILGKTVVSDPDAKAALLASLYDGLVPAPNPNGLKQIGTGCFNPRHGIRAELGGQTVDLLVCFECMKIDGYFNNHRFLKQRFINSAPSETFNRVLTAANVPLSPK